MICPEKNFVYLRKLREVRENFRMFYVCTDKFLVYPENIF